MLFCESVKLFRLKYKWKSYHDCEEDEIVKWFPLYEGDAMFPAQFCKNFQKIIFKCAQICHVKKTF